MDIKYTSTEEIKLFQENLLRRELSYLQDKSPFYRRMFQRDGGDIRKIRTLEDLQYIPFTRKSDLQQFNEDFICVPKEQLTDFVTTSGTMSDPATFAFTNRDLDRLAYNEKVSFECAGTKPGDLIQLMTTILWQAWPITWASEAWEQGSSVWEMAFRSCNGIPS